MMQIIDCEQGSEDWFKARLGIPTASEFGTIIAKGKDGKSPSLSRRTYMHKLASEILTGKGAENFSSGYLDRGKEMEPDARDLYAFKANVAPQIVGFIRNGNCGASPDSLIGDDGALEIKTKAGHLLIEAIFRDDYPPEHKAQCQGVLWIAERAWIDLAMYWPGLPLVIHRIVRDEEYIRALATAVDVFNDELRETVERVRAYERASA